MMYNYSVVEDKLNNLLSLVDKYQRNLQGVSVEDRETKYKKAFSKLRMEILYAAAEYTYVSVCSVYIPDGSSLYADASNLVKKHLPGIMHTIMKGEDVEEVVEKVRNEFLDNFYFPMMQTAVAS